MNFIEVLKRFFPRKKETDIEDYEVFNKHSRSLSAGHVNLCSFYARKKANGKLTNLFILTDKDGNEHTFEISTHPHTMLLAELVRNVAETDEPVVLNYSSYYNDAYVRFMTNIGERKVILGEKGSRTERPQEQPQEQQASHVVEVVNASDCTVVNASLKDDTPKSNIQTIAYLFKSEVMKLAMDSKENVEQSVFNLAMMTMDSIVATLKSVMK